MERVAVESSAVDRVAYEKGALDVRSCGGPAYRYFGVTRDEDRGLLDAESVGGYVNRRIKPFHRYARLPEP